MNNVEIGFEIYDNNVMQGHELLGKIYKSQMSEECLEAYTSFVKENRDNLPDMKYYLAGVAHKQLALMDMQLPPSQNQLPLELKSLFESLMDVHLQNFIDEVPWSLESIWVNIMSPGDFQPAHAHTGSLSFVWYLDVPQEIYEKNDEYVRHHDSQASSPYGEIHFDLPSLNNPWNIIKETFRPSTGDLFIFDSRYMHTVYPFTQKVERISISGNIQINDRMKLE